MAGTHRREAFQYAEFAPLSILRVNRLLHHTAAVEASLEPFDNLKEGRRMARALLALAADAQDS